MPGTFRGLVEPVPERERQVIRGIIQPRVVVCLSARLVGIETAKRLDFKLRPDFVLVLAVGSFCLIRDHARGWI